MQNKYVSARGVYYDLEKSPYEYIDELGNTFKFSSEKKLSMFENRVKTKEERYKQEIQNLAILGYDIKCDFETNRKRLPKMVYNDMLYK